MIKSMTGFGRASGLVKGKPATVEIRSVNSKGLDLNLKLPSRFRDKENELKQELGKLLERGKIDLFFRFENTGEESKGVAINRAVAISYYHELKKISDELQVLNADLLPLVFKMPEVFSAEPQADVDEEEWKDCMQLCNSAVESFNAFRALEGKTLQKDLVERIANIQSYLIEVEAQEPGRIKQIRDRITKNLAEFAGPENNIDKNRFEQEIVYYIEKIDITEEKVRLRSHCDYFMQTLSEDISNGRRLGFICQEIGREINTIGSKANDANMQRQVVQMKDELEKVKEQVLNIL